MKPFKRTTKKQTGYRSMTWAVHGFWSGDTVRVDQSRNWMDQLKWKAPKINWSCGGRDPKQEPDDIVAAECFGKSIADAVYFARKWSKQK